MHPLRNTVPRPGFCLIAVVVKPRRSWRHQAPTTVIPARAARHARTPTGLNPVTRNWTPSPTLMCRPACAGKRTRKRRSDPQSKPLAAHARAYVVFRSQPTTASRHPPPTETDRGPSTTLAAGRLRLRGPVRVRDRPIGCHHPRISPRRFESRV